MGAAKKSQNRRGRPPLDESERLTQRLEIRLSIADLARVHEAVRVSGLTLSRWQRQAILRAIRRDLGSR